MINCVSERNPNCCTSVQVRVDSEEQEQEQEEVQEEVEVEVLVSISPSSVFGSENTRSGFSRVITHGASPRVFLLLKLFRFNQKK